VRVQRVGFLESYGLRPGDIFRILLEEYFKRDSRVGGFGLNVKNFTEFVRFGDLTGLTGQGFGVWGVFTFRCTRGSST